ncbi:unnamed protein product [Diabrotica balteata]|uniref:Cysteine proteinase n=1 Tax=Diabrotica balteata TaxID=107213 RepID=A0A9N9T8U3_DIABA|nr:unnamed protein product [Diabrotica balteata]
MLFKQLLLLVFCALGALGQVLIDSYPPVLDNAGNGEDETYVAFDAEPEPVQGKDECLGCPTDVDPKAEGVDRLVNAALRHIESENGFKHVAITVLRVQKQVVAGFKYILSVVVGSTKCPKESESSDCQIGNARICDVEYLEQLWLGVSKIIKNNCTQSQEFNLPDPIDPPPAKVVDRQLEPDFLSDLESQIIPDNPKSEKENSVQFDDVAETKPEKHGVCAGCPVDIDPNDERVLPLVRSALEHIGSEKLYKQTAIKVLRVQVQVVAGAKYILLVEVGQTYCPIDSLIPICSLDPNQQSRICEVEFLERTTLENFSSIVSNNCTISQRFPMELMPTDLVPSVAASDDVAEPEAVQRAISCPGCPTNIDNDAESVKKLLNAALRHIASEDTCEYSAGKIHKVQRQVVAGVKYTLLVEIIRSSNCVREDNELSRICEIEYLDQRWMGISKIISNNCTISQEFNLQEPINPPQESVGRQLEPDFLSDLESQVIPDTKSDTENSVKEDSAVVKELAKIAAKHEGYENYEIVRSDVVDLDSRYYMLHMLFERNHVYADCQVYMTLNDVDVAKSTVDKVKCFNNDHSRHVRQIPGGISPISKDDPEVKRFLKDGLLHLDKESSHEFKFKIIEILEATIQVVSGSLHRIKAKIGLSDCKKESKVDASECGLQANGHSTICDFKVWDQPWIKNGRETNITCHDDVLVKEHHSFRLRRSLDENDETILSSVFEHFVAKYDKKYMNVVEHMYRFGVFKDNLKIIYLLNKHEQGTAVYKITKYTDMTPEEFSMSHGYRTDLRSENEIPFEQAKIPQIDLPTSFDWREKNAVTEIKDQGACGSCWAFSTTGNVEGQYAIKYKKLQSFSEQELVDCDKLDDGCNGGLMDNAYRTIEKLGGLELEREYPYEARDEKCHFNKTEAVVRLSGALNISHDETDMAKWLTQNGPISIAINANAMQFYAGGVSHPYKVLCNPKNLDHGVLIVGYGVHSKYDLYDVISIITEYTTQQEAKAFSVPFMFVGQKFRRENGSCSS